MTAPTKHETRPERRDESLSVPSAETNGIGRCVACRSIYVPVFPAHDGATADQLLCKLCIRDVIDCGYCRSGFGRCVGCDRYDTEGHLVVAALVCFSCVSGYERWAR